MQVNIMDSKKIYKISYLSPWQDTNEILNNYYYFLILKEHVFGNSEQRSLYCLISNDVSFPV